MEILMSSEFSWIVSTWTEYLCLECAEDQVVLSSRGYGSLAELSEYAFETEDGDTEHEIPDAIGGQPVVVREDGQVAFAISRLESAVRCRLPGMAKRKRQPIDDLIDAHLWLRWCASRRIGRMNQAPTERAHPCDQLGALAARDFDQPKRGG